MTGTAEVPLAGIYMDRILPESALPIKMVAFGHAFRTEAGSAGSASRGLYRVHQFSKVRKRLAKMQRFEVGAAPKVFIIERAHAQHC